MMKRGKESGIDKRDAFKKLFKIGLCDTGSGNNKLNTEQLER